MIKAKLFFGNAYTESADVKLNKWSSENPGAKLIHSHYQQARHGDHSICILYMEDSNE